MTTTDTPRLRDRLRASVAPFLSFYGGPFAQLNLEPDVSNFAVGNPQEMPLPGYVDALQRHVIPQDKDWFAYKISEPASQRTVAETLTRRTGMAWDPADVAMTNGGFGALAVAMRTLVEPGDEVVFLSPPWFFYEMLILAAGGEPIRVRLEPPAFDLDVDRVVAAISPRTRAVLVNSPHNPSGRIYAPETLQALASALTDASERIGHPVWIISDEPYNRIVFDGRDAHSPAEVYPHTLITYSYGKTLLAPGQRIGFATVPPTLPERAEIRDELFIQQLASGFAFPNALLQHALADLERLSIDIGALQRRRDRLVPALRELGYDATMPEGTFYTMARSPIEDDRSFSDTLARHRVLVLPGAIVEVPGWFRISLTASDDMVEAAIPRFAAAMAEARGVPSADHASAPSPG
jgi:aspartate aminotransferase